MAYCTYSDLAKAKSEKILAHQTDDTNGAVVDNSIITALIEEADGIIDSYLITAGETTPLSTVPDSIKSYSIRITQPLWDFPRLLPILQPILETRIMHTQIMLRKEALHKMQAVIWLQR